MSDAVIIAIITNATTILVVILSRLWSHAEHKATEATASRTEAKVDVLMNGK